MARLTTEWSTDDPQVAEALKTIMATPPYSPERHEAEAGLHMLQARWAWREADRLRGLEARRSR